MRGDLGKTGGKLGRALVLAVLVPAAVFWTGGEAGGQSGEPEVPFGVGEELTYRARSSRFGTFGTGTMAVEAGETVRGRETYRLHFDLRGKVGFVGVSDRARSWLDPDRMLSLRYHKRERSPVSSRTEEVELSPPALDELSFLYFIRTLPLAKGDDYTFDRHFDPARNPVRIRVLGRSRVTVPAGEFRVVQVEMRVRDPDRFGGEGVLRLDLTDDDRRLPVRIESSAPVVGTVVLTLESHVCPPLPGRAPTSAAGL